MFLYLNFYKPTADSKRRILAKGIKFYLFNWLLLGSITYFIAMLVMPENADPVVLKDFLSSNKYNTWILYLIVAIIMPLIEEGAFRLGLSFKKRDVVVALPLLSLYLLFLIFNSLNTNITIVKSILPIAMIAIIIIAVKIPEAIYLSLKNKIGTFIIYMSTILFALIHITNYPITDLHYFPIYCMLCLPQFAEGITATYFRLNLGFWYACGFHIIANSIIFIIR